MDWDVIVIGAGIGGLGCAAKLARNGCRVLVLEKDSHIGGTSYIFRRDGYTFPMGPLSFSFPGLVRQFLSGIGDDAEIGFKRNHFQLVTPFFDIIYSHPLVRVRDDLKMIFERESPGLDAFFSELKSIIALTRDIYLWHPDYRLDGQDVDRRRQLAGGKVKVGLVRDLSGMPSADLLGRYLRDDRLIKFLGSQGTVRPEISALNLAFMWNVMSEEGIWFPLGGIHGLSERLRDVVLGNGGKIELGASVEEIIVKEGRAVGVKTRSGQSHSAAWLVSNADYKRTFLEMIEPESVPSDLLADVKNIPFTDSELCVYLGIDAGRVDFGRMRATHLFYLHRESDKNSLPSDLEDFDSREIEICRWSDNAPEHAPEHKVALVLRVSFPYDHFARFRTGEKKRTEDYRDYKLSLARKLIQTAEHALPGLGSAVEVMEVATPLTYEDWGHRFRGSIAGWTWSADYERPFGRKLLIKTPIPNLLMAGIYAASELFFGGIPTSLHTADLAADIILASGREA
jgi:all-trans-retinol 13,14-reductase